MNRLEHCYQNKRVLVTGHTGFKGAWLSLWLHQLGAKVYGLSKDVPTSPSLYDVVNLSKFLIEDYRVDIRDFEKLEATINEIQPQFIFHLAAQPIVSLSYQEPVETLSTNILGTTHILETLRKMNYPCCAVIITSDKCYDNVEWNWGYRETDVLGGKDIYSGSKGAAELVFKSYFHSFFSQHEWVKVASARAGNVIGGGDWAESRIVPDCIRKWSLKEEVKIRQPKATRPWQHVLEPLSGYLSLGAYLNDNQCHGESYNFGPDANEVYTVGEVVNALKKYWPTEPLVNFGSVDFHEAGLLKLNCDKALSHLSWRATMSFNDTLAMTGEWYATFYKNQSDILTFTIDQISKYVLQAKNLNQMWCKNNENN